MVICRPENVWTEPIPADSLVEDRGFELPVPPEEDNRRDLPQLSAAAAFRLWQSEQG
jgi:hypothetical protein